MLVVRVSVICADVSYNLPEETITLLENKVSIIKTNYFDTYQKNMTSNCPINDITYGTSYALMTQWYCASIRFDMPFLCFSKLHVRNTPGVGLVQYKFLQDIAEFNNGSIVHAGDRFSLGPHLFRFWEYLFGFSLTEPCIEEVCTALNQSDCLSLFEVRKTDFQMLMKNQSGLFGKGSPGTILVTPRYSFPPEVIFTSRGLRQRYSRMRSILNIPVDHSSDEFNIAVYVRGGPSSKSFKERAYVDLVNFLKKDLKSRGLQKRIAVRVYHELYRDKASFCCPLFEKMTNSSEIDVSVKYDFNALTAFNSWTMSHIFITGRTYLGYFALQVSNAVVVFSAERDQGNGWKRATNISTDNYVHWNPGTCDIKHKKNCSLVDPNNSSMRGFNFTTYDRKILNYFLTK